MKKRYFLLIPAILCIIISAAAIGYVHFHPDQVPGGLPDIPDQPQLEEPDDSDLPDSDAEDDKEKDDQDTRVPTSAEKRAEEILDDMTLEEKVYQMLFVRPETLTNVQCVVRAGDATKKAIEEMPVGGIIYFSQNFKDRTQTSTMLSNTQKYAREAGAGIPMFMGVDEEGGTVARLTSALGTTKFEDMAVYGKDNDGDKAYEIGETLAKDISGFGFNVDFAPVADVISNENNTEIGDRSFGTDPDVVSNMVRNEVKGLQKNGVMATLKHFPGHGSTESNSHKGTSESDRTVEELRACDLLPFAAGMEEDAAFVLVSHMTATEIDDVPCTLSEKIVTDLLRKEMKYDGIAITDGMDMGAITEHYSNGEAAVKAVQAGIDVLLCPPSISDAVEALVEAVEDGDISEDRIDESVTRILRAKLAYGLMK